MLKGATGHAKMIYRISLLQFPYKTIFTCFKFQKHSRRSEVIRDIISGYDNFLSIKGTTS